MRAAKLTTLLESRISNFYTNFQVDEIGRVVSVGDGIARVYGLNEIQVGEMVEFASGVKGIALNLENENVGIVVFGSDTAIKEGDLVKRTGSIVDVPAGQAMHRLPLFVWSVLVTAFLLFLSLPVLAGAIFFFDLLLIKKILYIIFIKGLRFLFAKLGLAGGGFFVTAVLLALNLSERTSCCYMGEPEDEAGPSSPNTNIFLLEDDLRLYELDERLSTNCLERPHEKKAILPIIFQLEKKVEGVLISQGMPLEIVQRDRHLLRRIMFFPDGKALALKTYVRHLRDIEREGGAQAHRSTVFLKVVRAWNRHELNWQWEQAPPPHL